MEHTRESHTELANRTRDDDICDYCRDGTFTGNTCEHCLNTGLAEPYKSE